MTVEDKQLPAAIGFPHPHRAINTGRGQQAALITAVNERPPTNNNSPCRHPLPSIRETLLAKTQLRLFQTDTPPGGFSPDLSDVERKAFLDRITTIV
jgi:hypothetical protein